MTELLISSSAGGGLNTERAFELGRKLEVSGIEVLPYKKIPRVTIRGNPENIKRLSEEYDLPVRGVHLPFWWETKSLSRVMMDEPELKEKGFQAAWNFLIGPGKADCYAMQLADAFPDAYVLSHPDVFRQMGEERNLLTGRTVYFENERSKKREKNDLATIVEESLPEARRLGADGGIMFDPRHMQIDQKLGRASYHDLSQVWEKYKPQGMHFSFIGEGKGYTTGLPDGDTWERLSGSIKDYPPKVIVLEIGPNQEDEMKRARDMVGEALGI